MNQNAQDLLVRSSILHFLRDPGEGLDPSAWRFFEDGALLIRDGLVLRCGDWKIVSEASVLGAEFLDYRGRLLIPGFVDCHTHYPQARIMGSFGKRLLDWLENYTFPAECAFSDPEIARLEASHFVERLLAHGTTTASVFGTVHAHSVDAFFEAAEHHRLRMLCGKVMMDRNCPQALQESPEVSVKASQALIDRWHGRDRLAYAVTPRFAPTSSETQLALAGELFGSRPGLHLQTHLSETPQEVDWVRALFPERRDYVDVYHHYGLLGPGAVLGHGIHLSSAELETLAESGSSVAFCPSSNRFLGSGHFDAVATLGAGIRLGLASDVGAGSSLSMLKAMAAAYEVGMALGQALSASRAWFLATLGGAQALRLEAHIGNFEPGKEADFVVLDWAGNEDLAWRMERASSLPERLFALMMLGDERCIVATHILGRVAFRRTT